MDPVDRLISEFELKDKDLATELRLRAAAVMANRTGKSMTESTRLPIPTIGPTDAGNRDEFQQFMTEAVIRPMARPVMVIRDNRATPEMLGPQDARIWATRVLDAQAQLNLRIPAVGRINLINNPEYQWVGTGWIIDDFVIVTNRHVAKTFAEDSSRRFVFRLGNNQLPQLANIDFLEEYSRSAKLVFDVQSVLWIAPEDGLDVAFLSLSPTSSCTMLAKAIPLSAETAVNQFVATIGYPANDPTFEDNPIVRRIFGDVYDKKRLAPGQITFVRPDQLQHDCSTLGGNSGSALISLESGEAVGLHFAGAYLKANYAVPSSKLRQLLQELKRGKLSGSGEVGNRPSDAASPTQPPPNVASSIASGETIRIRVPIDITIQVGQPQMTSGRDQCPPPAVPPSPSGRPGDENPFERALGSAREMLSGRPDILDVRPGYQFKGGWISDRRAIVVEVRQKQTPELINAMGLAPVPQSISGFPVEIRIPELQTELRARGIDVAELEAPSKPGLYREPPNLPLTLFRERMQAIFHVSPDCGFPMLKAFFGRVTKHLTATIYEWEADYISDAVAKAITGGEGRTLTMVTQAKYGIAEGTEDAVKDMKKRIGKRFNHVFASVGSGKLIPSAYHIKVASRDGEEFWLSSGNWKDSNQPDIPPQAGNTDPRPLEGHNREWHAIIKHNGLATLFQKYIEWDFAEAQRMARDESVFAVLPDLLVPIALQLEAPRKQMEYFPPLEIDEELEVQPLLTPDRAKDGKRIFMKQVVEMIQLATDSIYIQNQSFSISAGNDEYEQFFEALLEKQKEKIDVKVIFRDSREYPRGDVTLKKTLEKIKDYGLDTGLFKTQLKCHTKGIIVDGKEVLLGSENLTLGGALFNRDASLLVRNQKVAKYFQDIFLFDWNNLASQNVEGNSDEVRLIRPEEEAPSGFRRMSLAEFSS